MTAPRSPPPRQLPCQSSDRLHALATMFVSISSPYRNQMLATCGGRFSRLARVKFLEVVLLGRAQMPLPTRPNNAGHLKKHRTSCLTGIIPCTPRPNGGKQTRPSAHGAQMRQAAVFLLLRALPGGLSNHPSLWSPSFANGPILWSHIQHSLGLVSTKARIDPGIPKT